MNFLRRLLDIVVSIKLIDVLRFLVLITGIMDAIKYRWGTQKIKRTKSAKNISRKFVFTAIMCDVFLIMYCTYIWEPVLIVIRCISLYMMCELYWFVYKYYPYKMRKLDNFKRPTLLTFVVNTCQPNHIRKRL